MAPLSRYSYLLRPIAWLYGLGVSLRNALFDHKILRSESYPIPLISVGNITVGGTGKTPHVEYILSLLTHQYRVAVISRGYKRKTKGQVIAHPGSSAEEIGDEPQQLRLKFPDICLVVDGNRRRAMRYLMALPKEERPEVVVLDDGMQHRYVQPSCSILLIDSSRPILEDRLLPEGELREPASARYRADIIIATKCPEDFSPLEGRIVERSLALYTHQKIFFSRTRYLAPRLLTQLRDKEAELLPIPRQSPLFVVTGIARPEPLLEYLGERYKVVAHESYPDHHNFRAQDLKMLNDRFADLCTQSTSPLYCLCTEKDAVRLWEHQSELSPQLLASLYYLPIEIEILRHKQEFERQIHLAARAIIPRL